MISMRMVAIPTKIAEEVRSMQKDPHYGFPAYTATAKGSAPCRHCLRRIERNEQATLFTYDAFDGQESLPLPGPVYIHAKPCERYPEDAGFPADFRHQRTLTAYGRGRKVIAQEYPNAENIEAKVQQLFARAAVDYIHVRSTDAGCYTFRIERADERGNRRQSSESLG